MPNNMPNTPLPSQNPTKKIWPFIVIPILLIIAVGLSVFLFMDYSVKTVSEDDLSQGISSELDDREEPETICIENWSCVSWGPCVSGQQSRTCSDLNSCGTAEDKPVEQQSCQPQVIDCGSNIFTQETRGNVPNFDCFIEASQNCEPSKLLNTLSVDIFGMLSTSTTYMELKGMESNKCIYYQRTENNSVGFTDAMVQKMLNRGLTQEEIEQQEQVANSAAKQGVGLAQVCKFDKEDLVAMLGRWKEGDIRGGASCVLVEGEFVCEYTGDFENAQCAMAQ